MRKIRLHIPILIVIIKACFSASNAAADKVSVFVSIVPQKYFVQQIGKDLIDVQVMVQPGASPHTYEPKPRQMAALSKTRIYFAIGVAFEDVWLGKIAATNQAMKIIHTDHGIAKIPMADHHHENEESEHHEKDEHSREDAHDQEANTQHEDSHEHGQLDPHIWLSPPLVMIQARTILNALQEIDPAHRTAYAANYRAFLLELADLDLELNGIFAGKHGQEFMVFHPAWGYFAHTYGLRQIPVEIEGKSPKPAQLKALIEHARENAVTILFAQPQFSAKSAELIAREIGGQVIFADPLAEDWQANLRKVANNFKAALR